jgi:very-short-patch-repair endonuclease
MAKKSKLPDHILSSARRLRINQTDAEQFLWYLLRNRAFGGFKFRRQHPLPPYVLDFYCHEQCLAIELDGGQHVEQANRDRSRDAYLEQHGIRTLRIWNHHLFTETEPALELIWRALHP